jgi:hypothetical protein
MQPVAILVPVEGGDDKAMLDMISPWATLGGLEVAELKKGMVFVGNKAALQRIKEMKAEARLDLARGLETGQKLPLCVAVALTADARRAILEIMPQLPAEVGGGSMELMTQQMEDVSIGISGTPGVSVLVQMKTAEGAVKMKDMLTTAVAALKQNQNVVEAMKEGENGKMLGELLDSLTFEYPAQFTFSGGLIVLPPPPRDVVLELGEKQMVLMVKMAVPGMMEELEATSMGNVRQLCAGVMEHRSGHAGVMPESLDVVLQENKWPAEMAVNPADAKGRQYEYHVWTAAELKKLDPAQTPVLWGAMDGPESRLVVGYLDGHVSAEILGSFLTDQLAKAKERAK